MVSLPTAILLAGALIGIGLSVGLIGCLFVLYRIFITLSVLRTADTPEDAAFLYRQFTGKKKKPQKVVAEMPDLEIGSLADNPDAMENMRKQQSSLSEAY